MKINRAYRVELDPNNVQRTTLLRHAGCARWAYNWGLHRKIEEYEANGKSPGAIALHRELNVLKKADPEDGGIPWMYEVSKCAPQEALRDLDRAFQHFFRRCKQGDKRKGFPRFKSRKRGIGGFRLTGTIKVTEDGRHVQLPKLGLLRVKERGYLPGPDRDDIRILSATVTEQAGHWFVSLAVEQEVADAEQPPTSSEVTTPGKRSTPASRGLEDRLRVVGSKSVSLDLHRHPSGEVRLLGEAPHC